MNTDVVIYLAKRMEHDKDGAEPVQTFEQDAATERVKMNLDDVVWAPCPREGYRTAKIKVRRQRNESIITMISIVFYCTILLRNFSRFEKKMKKKII